MKNMGLQPDFPFNPVNGRLPSGKNSRLALNIDLFAFLEWLHKSSKPEKSIAVCVFTGFIIGLSMTNMGIDLRNRAWLSYHRELYYLVS